MSLAQQYPARVVCRLLDFPRCQLYRSPAGAGREDAPLREALARLAGEWNSLRVSSPKEGIMSEWSAHKPEPIDGSGPDSAGFPAAQPAAPPQLPPDPAPDGELTDAAAGPGPAPRLAGRSRHGKRLVPETAQPRPPLTPPRRRAPCWRA